MNAMEVVFAYSDSIRMIFRELRDFCSVSGSEMPRALPLQAPWVSEVSMTAHVPMEIPGKKPGLCP